MKDRDLDVGKNRKRIDRWKIKTYKTDRGEAKRRHNDLADNDVTYFQYIIPKLLCSLENCGRRHVS